ncbi:helix-turn-helix transcriptional regulator [Caenimonas koreensis]|uniref:helix-turn-helix transcriptional regulator n=1 Tax=Caenimonas koreensis TaxID=367474 RepID=UPI003783E881
MDHESAVKRPAMVASAGHICFWQGGSLWLGRGAGRSDSHAHHAHQVAVSLQGTCFFRPSPDAPWTAFAGAVIASHREHQFEFDGTIAHLFVEPETPQGRALARYFAPGGIAALPADVCKSLATLLRDAEAAGQAGDALVTTGRSALALLTGTLAGGTPVDKRVAAAIDYVEGRVREPIALADAAAVACLSPGRFRHLFVAETGTPFRAYLLWLRLKVALQAALRGDSWTNAAHEAGFADSAHLTRTFKRMFGINPVDLSNVQRSAA